METQKGHRIRMASVSCKSRTWYDILPCYLFSLLTLQPTAQQSTFKPEPTGDYVSAPETLSQNASCSPQTDIWQLGCLVSCKYFVQQVQLYHFSCDKPLQTLKLLTGSNPPFISEADTPSRLAAIHAAIDDEDTKSIESALSGALHKDDVAAAAAFIKDCLRVDPSKRLTVKETLRHGWLSKANVCSCGYC